MGSIDKEMPKNRKKQNGQDWMQELNGQQLQGAIQQMQPMLKQILGHHAGKSTRLNMDGTLKDMNAPSGLDWLEAHGPDRASVQARQERLAQELRPEGGLPWMAQQGAQAVEAQKQLQAMFPQSQPQVEQRWGGDDVGAASVAKKDGIPVGFSTNTPQAKKLHQFSPHDFVNMLNEAQPPAAPYVAGSAPQPGDERMPVNAFVPQFNPQNPDNMYVRDRAGVRAREQERQKHNPYTEQAQPQPMDYVSALGDQLDAAGQQQGNMLADLFGYSAKLPPLPPTQIKPPATKQPLIRLVDPIQQTQQQQQGNELMADRMLANAPQHSPIISPFVGPPVNAKEATSSASQGFWDSPLGWLLQSLNPKNLSGLTSVPY